MFAQMFLVRGNVNISIDMTDAAAVVHDSMYVCRGPAGLRMPHEAQR